MAYSYRIEMYKTNGLFSGKIEKNEVEAKLNELSKDGWEIVTSCVTNRFFGESHQVIYTLKKEN
ncbi:MAG: DUF4177 domain-containing protein [Clostridiales bacterium]|nr:DUF4177 domain-containing protein [Clostridiales bacterium]